MRKAVIAQEHHVSLAWVVREAVQTSLCSSRGRRHYGPT